MNCRGARRPDFRVRAGAGARCARTSRMERNSWNEAAAGAPFTIYEPAAPQVIELRAGGFGWDGDVPLHVAVDGHLADGTEVSVDTQMRGRRASHSSLPPRIADLVWHDLVGNEVEVVLPISLLVEGDDQEIAVDGRAVTFAGARLAGSDRWMGTAAKHPAKTCRCSPASPHKWSTNTSRSWTSISSAVPSTGAQG
jgi:hypothetical protein